MTKKRRQFDLGVQLRETTEATTEQGEVRVDSADNKLKAFLDSSERAMVSEDQTQTITNKSIDADNNTVSNLEVDNLKSGVLDTDLSSVSASDDTLPSAKAVKTYVDDQIALKDQASEISYSNATSGLTATDVQAAIDENDGRLDTLEADTTLSTHLNGGASKHDGSEIDYERADGSKKNIDAASDDAESAITDLDDAIGALAASPTNYTPGDATIVADHLSAIDTALASLGGNEKADNVFRVIGSGDSSKKLAFEVDGIATSTTRTITMINEDLTIAGISNSQTLTNKTIDGDNNTISNLAHGAEVDNPSSGVHGVTGSVVGTSDTQDLSNKKFSDAISFDQIATPSNPAAGDNKLYFKSDDKLYKLTSGGAETEVGSGGGGSLTVEEEDASPSVSSVTEIKFPNGTLTDNTGGSVSYSGDGYITAWGTETITGAWTTNTTYNCKVRRVGDSIDIRCKVSLSGAPNSATFTLNMPTGFTIDTTKLPSYSQNGASVGFGQVTSGSGRFELTVLYNTSTKFTIRVDKSDGTYTNLGADVNQSVPLTWGNGDSMNFEIYSLPISGFGVTQ